MDIQVQNERGFIGQFFKPDDGDQDSSLESRVTEAINSGARVEWFTDNTCAVVWTAFERMWTERRLNGATVFDMFDEVRKISQDKKSPYHGATIPEGYIEQAMRYVDYGTGLRDYAKRLNETCVNRQVIKIFDETRPLIESNGVANTGTAFIEKILQVIAKRSGSREINIDEAVDSVMAQYEKAYDEITVKGNVNYTPGLPVPWPKMARLYNGYNAGYHILAGRPSVGKTSFALQLIRFWCEHGVKVLFNCLDMSVFEFLKRPISDVSKVTTRKAMFGRADKDHDFPALYEASKRIKKWYHDGVFALMEPEYDVNAFKAHCMAKKRMGMLDVVVVDFIQLMRYHGSERVPESQKVTYVSGILKSISNELKIPVLALSQLKRADRRNDPSGASEKGREPELDDLRSSGAIEQDAFTVTFLYQDDSTAKKWAESPGMVNDCYGEYYGKVAQPVWVHLKKNQNGDLGRIPFVVFKDTFSWYLGDYKAEPGDGKLVGKNQPNFSKVHDDWRHDKCEKTFAANGSIVWTKDEESARIEKSRAEEAVRKKNEQLEVARKPRESAPVQTTVPERKVGIQNDIPFAPPGDGSDDPPPDL